MISRSTVSQGFSGIDAALSAYAIMVFLFWSMHDAMPLFKAINKIYGSTDLGLHHNVCFSRYFLSVWLSHLIAIRVFYDGECNK